MPTIPLTVGEILRIAKTKEGLRGLETVLNNLNREIAAIKGRTLRGLIRAQIQIRREMDMVPPKIPVRFGNLRSSYFTVTSSGKTERGRTATFVGEDAGKMSQEHSNMMANEQAFAVVRGKRSGPNLTLGFTAYYAMYVHEMVGATFGRTGAGAKFLESAIQRSASYVLKVIREEARIK